MRYRATTQTTLLFETGEIQWSFDSFDMSTLLDNARTAMQPLAAAEDLTLEIIHSNSDLSTRADHARTQDVILRLVDNAIKFTPGGGRIQLRAETLEDKVRVRVEDSGNGIPDDSRERVFDHFTQLGDMMTDKPMGTGLGLARADVGEPHVR